MALARFFIEDLKSGDVNLPLEVVRHLHVLRHNAGDTLELFNGKGLFAKAILKTLTKKEAHAEVSVLALAPPPSCHWTLAFSVTSMEKMAFIVQKATELGIHAIQPLFFARSQPWPEEKTSKRLAHFEKIIQGAGAQCGENWLPTFSEPLPFLTWIQKEKGMALLLDPLASFSLKALTPQQYLSFIIGPEGGLTADEKTLGQTYGVAVSLGKNILRMETACLAVLAAAHVLWDL